MEDVETALLGEWLEAREDVKTAGCPDGWITITFEMSQKLKKGLPDQQFRFAGYMLES
jgi:hypothetical protein